MKRGFLNSSKAYPKDKAVTNGKDDKKQVENDSDVPAYIDAAEQSKEIGGLKRGSISVEGYQSKGPQTQINAASRNDYDASEWIMSTQPSRTFHNKLADHPDNWTECFITGGAKRKILETPGFPESLPRPTQPDCFRVVDLPGKGRGVIATKDIKWGDLVLAERALLMHPAGFPSSVTGLPAHFTNAQRQQAMMMDIEKIMDIMVKRMPEENQKAFKDLWNCHTEDGSGPLFGISRTNGFGIEDFYEPVRPGLPERASRYSGTFNVLSRLNHSCQPNVDIGWDSPAFAMILRASRDIKAGDELCISYISNLLSPTASRQRDLRSYGFQCTCGRCSNSSISDARSEEFREINKPKAMMIEGDSRAGLRTLREEHVDPMIRAIKLLEQEGLTSIEEYGNMLSRTSQASASILDKKSEQKYKKMYETFLLATRSARNAMVKELEEENRKQYEMVQEMMRTMSMATASGARNARYTEMTEVKQ